MAEEKEPMVETKIEKVVPATESAEGPKPSGGGLQEFLFQFLKANPDLAREMSTRMNAVINGQRLQGMKGAAPGGPPGAAPQGIPVTNPQMMGIRGEAPQPPTMQQMAGDVIPLAGEKSMGPGETPNAAGYATGQQTAPNVHSIGTPTLQEWLANVKARQG